MWRIMILLVLAGTLLQEARGAQINIGSASGFPGEQVVVSVSLTADGVTADFNVRVEYNEASLGLPSVQGVNGGVCGRATFGRINVSAFSGGPLPAQAYCQITFPISPAAPAGPYVLDGSQQQCFDSGGNPTTCTVVDGQVTILEFPVPPTLSYNPAVGNQILFPGGAIGATVSSTISVTPSGGSGFGTASVGNFSVTGSVNGSVSPPSLNFVAGTGASQSITVFCTLGSSQTTGSLSATQSFLPGGSSQISWNLLCPAGTPTNADLSVSLSDSPDPVTAGTNLTYTAIATNNGPAAANQVSLSLPLPAGTSFVSATPSAGGSCNAGSPVNCTWSGATNSGSSRSVAVVVAVAPGASGALSATATGSSTTPDPNTANNSASASTTVNASANLSTSLADSPDPVTAGTSLTYTAIATNSGPSAANQISLSLPLPAGTSFVSATPSAGGSCSAGSPVSCTWSGATNSGASRSATIVVAIAPGVTGTLSATATASSATNDPNLANNSASASTTVIASADLQLTPNTSATQALVNAPVTLTATSANEGPSAAQNVNVSINLGSPFRYSSHTATGASCTTPSVGSSGTVSCTWAGATASSPSRVLTVAGFGSAAGTATIQMSTSSSTTDPVPANNSAQLNIQIAALPSVQLHIAGGATSLAACSSGSPTPVGVYWSSTGTLAYCRASDGLHTNWLILPCIGEDCPGGPPTDPNRDGSKLRTSQLEQNALGIVVTTLGLSPLITNTNLDLTCYSAADVSVATARLNLPISHQSCTATAPHTPSTTLGAPTPMPNGTFQFQSSVANPQGVPLTATIIEQGQYGDAVVEMVGNTVVIRYLPRNGGGTRATVVNETIRVIIGGGGVGVPVTYTFQIDLALFSSGFEGAQVAPTLTAGDGAGGDRFGTSVAVDGSYAVVGAENDDIGGNIDQGSAYVYLRTGGVWSLQQKLTAADGQGGDKFGVSTSIFGDTLLVGAFNDDVGSNQNQGSVYVFRRSGSTWTQEAKLTAADGAAFDEFGFRVSLDANTALVGAVLDDVGASGDQGSAYVFVRNGNSWSQQAKLLAPDGAGGDFLGRVSLSGDTALLGSFGDDIGASNDQGSAHVFVRNGGTWSHQAKLTAADGAGGNFFGLAVALSGNLAVVGAPGNNGSSGAAYVFVRNGTSWSQQARLVPSDLAGGDFFGDAVAASGNGVLVASTFDDIGAAFNQGSAYLFRSSAGTWTQRRKLTAANGIGDDRFGISLAIQGTNAWVGAPLDDVGSNVDQGSVSIFDPVD